MTTFPPAGKVRKVPTSEHDQAQHRQRAEEPGKGVGGQGNRSGDMLGATDAVRAQLQGLTDDNKPQRALALATALFELAEAQTPASHRRRRRMLAALMQDEVAQAFTTLMTDRAFRAQSPRRAAFCAAHLIRRLGIPSYLGPWDRARLWAARWLPGWLPGPIARGVRQRVKQESAPLVLRRTPAELDAYLKARHAAGVRVNLNPLGEAVMGEAEAERRRVDYCELARHPAIDALSLKLSAIHSQLDPWAFEASVEALSPRLASILDAAQERTCQERTCQEHTCAPAPLVMLDMEAYRDVALTLAVFRAVLDDPKYLHVTAGVALQAYLPDAAGWQRWLTAWAVERRKRGGAPLRIRLVKGANLALETVESAQRGWALPIYPDKRSVDANFKRMLEYACHPEHADAVGLGIASHNVFDIAFGLLTCHQHGVADRVEFELLEGMAPGLARALRSWSAQVLVYAPVISDDELDSTMAYLVRRLDENTGPGHFLRESFDMAPADARFDEQATRFLSACAARAGVTSEPLRAANRRGAQIAHEAPTHRAPTHQAHTAEGSPGAPLPRSDGPAGPATGAFCNAPDTDMSLAHNRAWLQDHLARAQAIEGEPVPMQIDGERSMGRTRADGFDPSRPGLVPYFHALCEPADLDRALEAAVRVQPGWSRVPRAERAAHLRAVAAAMAGARGDLIGAIVLDAGKRAEQADTEVSEAIDFANYYAACLTTALSGLDDPRVRAVGRGVTLVTPPWNFPLAIAAGGVLAAIAAGNAVILKPAPETVLVASRFAALCEAAGLPKGVLQLCPCLDSVASQLVRDPRVANVVLTGATATAELFLSMRPDMHLLAETGGKNAIIVTELSDRDVAIEAVVRSAFLHAGQKCSAASLLILEAGVYDDPSFQARLRDATLSMPVGSAWAPTSQVTPLIHPPAGPLARALASLDPDETWLVPPQADAKNPRLLHPAIRWGVQPGAFTHRTELFGPVLSVMRAADLHHAIEFANGTGYGLTSGLQSLDEREHRTWQQRIAAGNLYINRGITGAIVGRQPFGGRGRSSFGPGAKAGGPNYLLQLMDVHAEPAASATPAPPRPAAAALLAALKPHIAPPVHQQLARAACEFAHGARQHFDVDHDPNDLPGERNLFRYRPRTPMAIRVAAPPSAGASVAAIGDRWRDALLCCLAAATAGCPYALSVPPTLAQGERAPLLSAIADLAGVVYETAEALADRLADVERVRCVGPPEAALAAGRGQPYLDHSPVHAHARLELVKYYREQVMSHRYDRHGNLAAARLLPPLRQGRPA